MVGVVGNGKASNSNYICVYIYIYIYIYNLKLLVNSTITITNWVRLRTHIKLFIFENIFSRIEKTINTFLIHKKFFSKNENYCTPHT